MIKMLLKITTLTVISLSTLTFATVESGQARAQIHPELPTDHQLTAQRQISKEEAKSIALKQVKGRVIYVDLDKDDGIMKYEVIILSDQNKIYEVEINANTGEVIKVEQEND